MKEQAARFLELKDPVLHQGTTGLLCNQTSFVFSENKYLFEILAARGILKKVFIPEHGLFSELQDQVTLNSTEIYQNLGYELEYISLYQGDKRSLKPDPSTLSDLDAIIIDIRDIGSRYFTYINTVRYLFNSLSESGIKLTVYIIDYPNPAGRQVEGTIMKEEYSSFIGLKGIPHRHGLTAGEVSHLFKDQSGGNFDVKIIHSDNPFPNFDPVSDFPYENITETRSLQVQPSPNIPGLNTVLVYPGQCLLEGTVLSEGRGTTRPFEIFGAPFLNWQLLEKIRRDFNEYFKANKLINGIILRPLLFKPVSSKYEGELCGGFQLHLINKNYHSLLHSLILLRQINEAIGDINLWKTGKYEYGSDKTAIELIAGDAVILNYLKGKTEISDLLDVLNEGENEWINRASPYLIYDKPLKRTNISSGAT